MTYPNLGTPRREPHPWESRPHRSDCTGPHVHECECPCGYMRTYRCADCRSLVHLDSGPGECEHTEEWRDFLFDLDELEPA